MPRIVLPVRPSNRTLGRKPPLRVVVEVLVAAAAAAAEVVTLLLGDEELWSRSLASVEILMVDLGFSSSPACWNWSSCCGDPCFQSNLY